MHVQIRTVNNSLLAAVVLINAYIIVAPFAPKLSYWWQSNHTQQKQMLSAQLHNGNGTSNAPQVAQANQLIAPTMLLSTPVQDGPVKDTYKILANGIWRWPLGSTPDKGSNTILIGHRFTYTNPRGIFYNLDKLKPADEIAVVWNNQKYVYRIVSSSVVPPSDTSILNQSSDDRLTLYTCTPTWNPKNRLVVVAIKEAVKT